MYRGELKTFTFLSTCVYYLRYKRNRCRLNRHTSATGESAAGVVEEHAALRLHMWYAIFGALKNVERTGPHTRWTSLMSTDLLLLLRPVAGGHCERLLVVELGVGLPRMGDRAREGGHVRGVFERNGTFRHRSRAGSPTQPWRAWDGGVLVRARATCNDEPSRANGSCARGTPYAWRQLGTPRIQKRGKGT